MEVNILYIDPMVYTLCSKSRLIEAGSFGRSYAWEYVGQFSSPLELVRIED